MGSNARPQRYLPGILAGKGLRQRNLLSGGDTDHHPVIRKAVGFDIQQLFVPTHSHVPEVLEMGRNCWLVVLRWRLALSKAICSSLIA